MKNFLINIWTKLFGKTKETTEIKSVEKITHRTIKVPAELKSTCKCGCGKSGCQCDFNCKCDGCGCNCDENCSCKKKKEVKKQPVKPKEPVKKQIVKIKPKGKKR